MGKKMSKSYNNFIDIFLEDKKLRKQILGIKQILLLWKSPKNAKDCNVFKLI